MDSIPKFMASVITIIIGVVLCISFVISAVVVNSARTYHSSVIEQIEASNFEEATIEKCIKKAEDSKYVLNVEKTPTPESDPTTLYKVTLNYGLYAPIFGKVHNGELVGYALAGSKIVNADGTGGATDEEIIPGLYETGKNYDKDALIISWDELVADGILEVKDGVVSCKMVPGEGNIPPLPTDESKAALAGDLLFPVDGSITATGEYSFTGCEKLTGIRLPDSLKTIGMQSFDGNHKMETVDLGKGLESAGVYAFAYCGVTKLTYSGTLEEWCNIDFTETSSTPIGDDNSIPTDLYINGKLVDSIMLPTDFVLTNYNLSGISSLRSLHIPDGTKMTTIPEGAFWKCTNSFTDDLTDGLRTVYIGKGVENIEAGAFTGCDALKMIYISDTVTNISPEGIFHYCDSLDSIIIDEANPTYKTSADNKLIIGKTDSSLLFVPSSTENLIIPDDIEIINEEVCSGYDNLKSVTIPSSVKKIGQRAFVACEYLNSMTYKGTIEEWNKIEFGEYWNYNAVRLDYVQCDDGRVWF